MSSTYSPILRTELIGSGDQAGAWGATTNSNFQYVFESAIAGYQAVTVSPTSNNQVLTYVNGPSASPALNQSIYGMLKLNAGTLGANFNIFAPPVSKTYLIWNNTSYTASFYNSTVIGNTTPAGSAAVIPAGAKVWVWSDGSSFYGNDTTTGNFNVTGNLGVSGTLGVTGAATFTSSIAAQSASFTLPLPILSGGTGTTSFTGTGSVVFSASPALSGTPTAPTAAAGTSTTQIATTAFVQNVAGGLGTMSTQNANNVAITGGTITGSYGLTAANATNAVNATNATTATTATNANKFQNKTQLGLGITGETWNDVTGSRSQGVNYYNTNAYPIQAVGNFGCNGGGQGYIYINGTLIAFWQAQFNGCGGYSVNMPCIVPPGAYYQLANMGGSARGWYELY
jgi:hypothetical protein